MIFKFRIILQIMDKWKVYFVLLIAASSAFVYAHEQDFADEDDAVTVEEEPIVRLTLFK